MFAGSHEFDQGTGAEQPIEVLRQSAIAHLAEAELEIHEREDMLDPRARLALDAVLFAAPQQAMALSNGRLGIAVWAQDGYTAQLNRGDTFPLRLSAGQVVIPGLGCIDIFTYAAAQDLVQWADGQFTV